MKISKSVIDINGKPKVVVAVNYKDEPVEQVVEERSVDCLHHIHIIDRSGSMGGEIVGLIENVKETIDFMDDRDYVSVIWFSGVGQHKAVIKGARKDESIKKVLDTLKSTVGCTCFSEPLQEANELINELGVICPNFSVTLFTDGCPVVPWSEKEEIDRIFNALDLMKEKVIAVNTVGYGGYYNRDLLVDMAKKSMFGEFVHSNKIDEYMGIFSHNYERVSELMPEVVRVSGGDKILYLNRKSSKMVDSYMELNMLDKKKNTFYIVGEKEFDFSINDVPYSSKDIKGAIAFPTKVCFLYAYAYESYIEGNRQLALDVIAKVVRDKYLVDKQVSAFTNSEIGGYLAELKEAIFHVSGRLKSGDCGDNYIPADDAVCIVDILKLLSSGDNYYIMARDYNRIGLKVEDTFSLFKATQGDVLTPISEFVFNKDKLNISIRNYVPGIVRINPRVAEKVGLPKEVPSFVYRNQTIIKDGMVNMNKMEVIVDDNTLKSLKGLWDKSETNFLGIDVEPYTVGENVLSRLVIFLDKLPIVNRTYLNDSGNVDNIFDSVVRMLKLECSAKVVNSMIKEYGAFVPVNEDVSEYNAEQLEALKEHGLDGSGMYVGVENVKAKKEEADFYEARTMEFTIKGASSIPKLSDVLEKGLEGKELKLTEKVMSDTYVSINETISTYKDNKIILNRLKEIQKDIKSALMTERVNMASLKIAKVLTGDWFLGLDKDPKKGTETFTKDGLTMVLKTDREVVYY